MKISPKHPIRNAKEWDDGLLAALPEPILRWFAADCAERVCLRRGLRDEGSIKAVIAARMHALEEIEQDQLVKFRRLAQQAGNQLFFDNYQAFGRQEAGFQTCRSALIPEAFRAAKETAENAVKDALTSDIHVAERRWQVERLHSLVQLWDVAEYRTLWLLWDGQSPLD